MTVQVYRNGAGRGLAVGMASLAMLAQSARAVTVKLTDADARSVVMMHVGDRLRVDLPTAPAAGFRWTVKKTDASHLEEMGRAVRPDSGRLDAAGVQVFVWKALSPGEVEIRLSYSRPLDEKTMAPEKAVSVTVKVAAGELPAGEAIEPAGVYRGELPCEGCQGIDVELTLYAKGDSAGAAFVERRRYLGAPGGVGRTVAGSGTWEVVHGTYADASMMVYRLHGADGEVENFKLVEESLVPLDGQMLPVAGTAEGLRKVADASN